MRQRSEQLPSSFQRMPLVPDRRVHAFAEQAAEGARDEDTGESGGGAWSPFPSTGTLSRLDDREVGRSVSPLVPDQMQVLNDAFAGSRFAFTLESLEVIANNAWFLSAAGSPEEIAMKAALHRGGPESLNIYTTNGAVYLGWATFPFFYKFAPSYDGVVLWWAALPGTGLEGARPDEPDGVLTYDEGDTGTHEVGPGWD